MGAESRILDAVRLRAGSEKIHGMGNQHRRFAENGKNPCVLFQSCAHIFRRKIFMIPLDILAKFYDRHSKAFEILVEHGRQVAPKALSAAARVADRQPDLNFIQNAAMLHDIGILHTDSPKFACRGKYPYIRFFAFIP
jgi:hypothetical protein